MYLILNIFDLLTCVANVYKTYYDRFTFEVIKVFKARQFLNLTNHADEDCITQLYEVNAFGL